MAKDVFISYAQEDRSYAEEVCAELENAGIGCWIAPRDIAPGVTWPAAITAAIRDCRAMIVIFSRHANESKHMGREVEVADSRHVPILPVRVEEIEPSGDLEYFLGNRQWFDLHGGKIERRRGLPEVVGGLLGKFDAPAAAERPPRRSKRPWAIVGAGAGIAVAAIAIYMIWTRVPPAPVASNAATRMTQSAPAAEPSATPAAVAPPADAPATRTAPARKKAVASSATPAPDFSGKWRAEVRYHWGDRHNETFDFKIDGNEVFGTASYLGLARGIRDGKIDGGRITFTTSSQALLGDKTYDMKHAYRGRMSGDAIEFMLQTDSGYDSRPPETFTARRVE